MAITIQTSGIQADPSYILQHITNINLLASMLGDIQTIGANAATTTGDNTFTGNVTITGNLEVDGTIQHDGGTLTTTDKNILINKGGTTAGAVSAGLSIEGDAAAVVGYIMTGAADNSVYTLKAPGNAGVMTLDINATKTWTVGGALNVSGDSEINQSLLINSTPAFTAVALSDGTVGALAVRLGADGNNGIYGVSDTQMGFAIEGVQVAVADTLGFKADSLRNRVNIGTTPVGTVSIVEYGDGRDITAVLTLTNFIIGALDGAAAAKAIGNIVYAFPVGQHLELVYSFSNLVLTAAGTAVPTDTGLGSVIAVGAVNVLSGTAAFEDRLTGQTIATGAGGGAAASALRGATAGIGTGIALNGTSSVKNVFLNSAGDWNANNTGNLTATGTIVLKWTIM